MLRLYLSLWNFHFELDLEPTMIESIKSVLTQPFPEDRNWIQKVKLHLGIAIFVGVFLYVLRPFGLAGTGEDLLYYAFQHALITFLIPQLWDFTFEVLGKLDKSKPSWTFGWWIMYVLAMVSLIGVANFLFLMFNGSYAFQWTNLFSVIISTLIVGVFPVTFLGYAKLLKAATQNQKIATRANQSQSFKHSDSSIGSLEGIPFSDIWYIESMQNYVKIIFRNKAEFESKIIRSTIKSLSEKINGSILIRCHRSYIVNRSKIETIDGNAQGLKLFLQELPEETIPVSRKYIPFFR